MFSVRIDFYYYIVSLLHDYFYACSTVVLFVTYVSKHLVFYLFPQDGDLSHRGKLSQSLSAGSLGGGCETKSDNSHLRHTTSMDLSHMPRIQRDTISPSYTSPMALSHKQELVLQKGPPVFMSSPPAAPLSSFSELRPEGKLGHSGYRSVDMVQLLTVMSLIMGIRTITRGTILKIFSRHL